jgi:two-component system, NtrC family, response regulator AtoC
MPSSRGRDLDNTTAVDSGVRPPGDVLMIVGDGHIRAVPFASGALTIGRALECDVVVDHPKFSRRHARITRDPEVRVQDLGSTNGTRIGGTVYRGGDPVQVHPGETFHIGPFSFVVTASAGTEGSSGRSGRERLVVAEPARDRVAPLIGELAASGVNVLLQGETGVGKDVLATTLHDLSGRTGPLVRINCAALSESLLESELFGYVKGAFTGATADKDGLLEAASGGTVFLDEIGELPPGVQAKLLHAIEARQVTRLGATRPVMIDARFIAATNRDLAGEVAAGRFRRDLFFRIDGITLHIPPLRERISLIGPLALRFLHEAGERLGRPAMSMSADGLVALEAHPWPGNVRELRAVIERAVLIAKGAEIAPRHLMFAREPAAAAPAAPAAPPPATAPAGLDFLSEEELEDRARVIAALADCSGNQTRAAKLLGISRTTLVNKLTHYRIPRPRP